MLENRTTEEIWRRLKRWAQERGDSRAPLPSDAVCLEQAKKIAFTVFGELPAEAVTFYGFELCAMIEKIRQDRIAAAAKI